MKLKLYGINVEHYHAPFDKLGVTSCECVLPMYTGKPHSSLMKNAPGSVG